jgi:hypothetical protein
MTMNSPQGKWARLREDAVGAVAVLAGQLEDTETTHQNILDAYIFAKNVLAQAMQALIRLDLPENFPPFHDMRKRLGDEMAKRYGDRISKTYLTVPYSSRVHEELFTLLFMYSPAPVSASMLRVVTADSVHAERRTRELRELGLQIRTAKSNGSDTYALESLELDPAMIPAIIKNNIRAKGPGPGTAQLLRELGF